MLLLFLPVNVYAAQNRVGMGGHTWGPGYLLIRVPLQAILASWTWWFAIRPMALAPIRFACAAILGRPPAEIAGQILDLERWPEFTGFGPLPGIKSANIEVRTHDVVGTRIRVLNTDGSSHVEEIIEWEPTRLLRLQFYEFSPPLSRLATSFDETWEFEQDASQTCVVRSFAIHPKSALTRPFLWFISRLLQRAIARHLRQLQDRV